MRRLHALILTIVLGGCTQFLLGDDPTNTAVDIFDEFWKGVDRTWPEFGTKHVNWDSLYAIYRPQVNTTTNDAALLGVLKALLYNLKDRHTDVFPKSSTVFLSYQPVYPSNFYGINWVRSYYNTNMKANNALVYGLVGTDIGYIYIGTFVSDPSQYQIIDQILAGFEEVKGIIIDVRDNGGGYRSNAEIISSRFADRKRTYDYMRFRTGKTRDQMGDFLPEDIAPAGPKQFKGKVVVLSNRNSFSATENFILMMKSFPQVVQVGDNTLGGSGTLPLFKELPRGWYFRVSSALLSDLNLHPINNGIPPDIYAQTNRTDSLNGKDGVLERAMIEARK